MMTGRRVGVGEPRQSVKLLLLVEWVRIPPPAQSIYLLIISGCRKIGNPLGLGPRDLQVRVLSPGLSMKIDYL